MFSTQATIPSNSPMFRIGEVAKLTDLTTRTLRYWEEIGLVRPTSYGANGQRCYSREDVTRVARISDLQRLLGFSLAEVRVVLDTEEVDVLDRVRSELRCGNPSAVRQRELLDEAIAANDQLLTRLEDTLERIGKFRDERIETARRLQARRLLLEDSTDSAVSESLAQSLVAHLDRPSDSRSE